MPTDTTAEDEFGKFFDNLSDLAADKKPIPADFGAPVVEPAVVVETLPAVTDPVITEPVTEPTVTTDTAPVVEPTETEVPTGGAVVPPVENNAPPVVTPAQPDNSEALLERFIKAMESRPPPVAGPQAPQPTPKLYTDEEVAALSSAEKDYPDLIKAMQLLLRGSAAVNNTQLLQQIGSTLAPALQNLETVQINHHENELHRLIPDYDKVATPVVQWARTDPNIPAFLRNAYEGVITNGDANDIADLVGAWRKATGIVTQQGQPAKPAVKPVNELSETAKQAAVSLAPVASRRTAVVTTAVPEDFSAAFDHWAIAKA